MKKYLIWFFLLMKRKIKAPAFVLMLIGMFILSVAVYRLEQTERAESTAGIIIEINAGEDSLNTKTDLSMTEQDLSGTQEEWNQRLVSQLHEQKGILTFRIYEDKDKLMQDVEKGDIDCGFVIPENLCDKMASKAWQNTITVYSDSSSVVTNIAKERIAAAVFTLYSEDSYINYVKNAEAFDTAQEEEDGKEEIIDFAKRAYKTHFADASTFGIIYNGDINGNMAGDGTADSQNAGWSASTGFRLRGILALCIFVSGMCGLLTDWKDRNRKRFVRIVPDRITTLFNILVPTVYTALMSVAVMLCTNSISGPGELLKELCRLMIYQFLIVVYCSIIRLALRKQETIAAAIPILTLASIICSPVFIRLAVYVPVFRILEKFFPATYYLLEVF